MKCPFCGTLENRVVDSRMADDGSFIRRRRECECSKRFTTYEYIDLAPIRVTKRGGSVELFNRDKLLEAVARAAGKGVVDTADLESLVDEIQRALRDSGVESVPSATIGKMVMERLRVLDRVAYVRFASVYREFQEVDEFREVLQELEMDEGTRS